MTFQPLLPEQALCGPRAMMAVCRNWGLPLDLRDLVDWTDCGPDGCSFAGLARAALRIGWQARGVRATAEQAITMLAPAKGAIVQVKGRHFIALLQAGRDARVSVYDPAARRPGPFDRDASWLEQRWTGNTLFLFDGQRTKR